MWLIKFLVKVLFVLIIISIQISAVVASEVLLSEDFNDGYAQEFGNEIGNWEVRFVDGNNGLYTATNGVFRFSLAGNQHWEDYTLEADFLNAQDGGLLIRASDRDNGVALIIRPTNNDIYWHIRKGGNWGEVLGKSSLGHESGEDLNVKIEAEGSEFRAYINGELKTSLTTTEFQNGKIGLYLFQQPEQYWDDVVVYILPPPVIMQPFACVDIESVPVGAQIWMDGVNIGEVTPFRQYFENDGKHTFELYLTGYYPHIESFDIPESMPEIVTLVPLPLENEVIEEPISSPFIYVSINSDPQGAQIWVDDDFSGKSTPDKIYFEEEGSHSIKLTKEGYQTHEEQIYCSESMTKEVTLKSEEYRSSPTPPVLPEPIIDPTPFPDSTPKLIPGFYALFSLSVIFIISFLIAKNRK